MTPMRQCPFCTSTNNTIIVKTLRNGAYYGTFAAYGYCRTCKARGSLVKHNDTHDIRNERITDEGRANLVERAIDAWNGIRAAEDCLPLPLFDTAEKNK